MKNTSTDKEDQDKIWNSIIRQFEFVTGAQISNSFIVLMALSESKESLSTTQVSEIISSRSEGIKRFFREQAKKIWLCRRQRCSEYKCCHRH